MLDINTTLADPEPYIMPENILAIIPTLNEERHIEACIRSLMDGEADLRKVPLTVADGGSTDRTIAIVEGLQAEFPNIRIVNNPKRLQSAAMNLAAKDHATALTHTLVRCDAHSIYPANFILDVARSMDRQQAASLVIPMDATGETCFEKANAWIVDTPLGSGGSAHRGGRQSAWVDHGHHAGFNLSMFRQISGYDESFSHNEDAEYDARVAQAGGRIFMDADIRIQYVPRSSVTKLAKQYYNYGKGRAKNVKKHNSRLKLRQSLPLIVLALTVLGVVAAPVFWPALILPLGYISALTAASIAVAVWKKSPCGLLAGLASGTMHMSWAAGFLKQSLFGRA